MTRGQRRKVRKLVRGIEKLGGFIEDMETVDDPKVDGRTHHGRYIRIAWHTTDKPNYTRWTYAGVTSAVYGFPYGFNTGRCTIDALGAVTDILSVRSVETS